MDGFFMIEKKITKLSVQKRNPERVNVYLDDEFAFGLERMSAAWLTVGQILSDEQIAKLLNKDQGEKVYAKALSFLQIRVRSEAEVREKLKTLDCDTACIEETINRLKKNGLLGDENFSAEWVENRNTFRPRSRRMLACELRQKGVSDDVIQASLEEVDDFETAFELANRRLTRLKGLEWNDFRKKLGSYLAGKGYGYDVIQNITRRVWEESMMDTMDSTEKN